MADNPRVQDSVHVVCVGVCDFCGWASEDYDSDISALDAAYEHFHETHEDDES